MSSKQRNKLLLKHKYEIINKIENNVKRSEIIKEYKLKSDSNNCKILKSKAKIIANYEKFNPKASKSTSYIRSSNYPGLYKVRTMPIYAPRCNRDLMIYFCRGHRTDHKL